MDKIRPRWFRRNLQTALRVLPVSVLTGARQTGKTTLTRAIEPGRAYFTLDDVGVLDQAERNPDSLLATRPVILDEVQRAPQILLAVKRAVDTHRRAGDFILTGSANLLLMKHVAETLAGRAIYLEIHRRRSQREWDVDGAEHSVEEPPVSDEGQESLRGGRHGSER
jgi:predicted AAA+ superfamily ATPase